MNIRYVNLISLLFFLSTALFSQVHIFEQGRSGILIPVISGNTTTELHRADIGISYIVEGKFALTGRYGLHFSDTAFNSSDFLDSIPIPSNTKSKYKNLEAAMEVIEPDKVYPISVVLKLGYKTEDFSHRYDKLFGDKKVSIYPRRQTIHNFYGGLIFGFRFFTGPRTSLVPSFEVDPAYLVTRRRNVRGLSESRETWEIKGGGGLLFNQMFTDYIGLMVEPYFMALYNFGEDFETSSDDNFGIVAKLSLGLVLQFN